MSGTNLASEATGIGGARYSSVKGVQANYGLSRRKIYEALSNGQIEAVKLGRRTLLDVSSVEKMMAALPRIPPRSS